MASELIKDFLEKAYTDYQFLNEMGIGSNLLKASPSIDAILRNQDTAIRIWAEILKEKENKYLGIEAIKHAIQTANSGATKLKFCYELFMNIHH